MTVSELLEARESIRNQLDELKMGALARHSAFGRQNKTQLTEILEAIDAKLAERGYEHAQES